MSKIARTPTQRYKPQVYTWKKDQIPDDQTTHEQLFHVFQEYFKTNIQWLSTGSSVSGNDCRYWLAELIKLAKNRSQFITDWEKYVNDHSVADRDTKATSRTKQKALDTAEKEAYRKKLAEETGRVKPKKNRYSRDEHRRLKEEEKRKQNGE